MGATKPSAAPTSEKGDVFQKLPKGLGALKAADKRFTQLSIASGITMAVGRDNTQLCYIDFFWEHNNLAWSKKIGLL